MLEKYKSAYKLYKKAFGSYKKQITLLTVLALLNAFLEGIGINALIPILSYYIKDNSGQYNFLVKLMQEFFNFLHIDFSLKQLLIFVIIIFIGKALIMILTNYIKILITTSYETKTRGNLLRSTLNANWPYLSKQKIGYLENTIKIDTTKSSTLLQEISSLVIALSSLLVYVIVAINISPLITLSALTSVSLLLIAFKPILKLAKRNSQALINLYRESAHHINQSISGVKAVKAATVESQIADRGDNLFKQIRSANIKQALLKNIPGSLLQPMGMIFVCILMGLSYKLQNFDLAILLPIIYLVERIFDNGKRLQGNLNNLSELTPYLMSTTNYLKDSLEAKEYDESMQSPSFNKTLCFKGISFQYPDKSIIVLDNLDFTINKGELIGIIGPSGGGKTTLVDLILRLLEPSSGQILLDGKNIDKISLKEWRHSIGYVSQDIFLLNDTIANNIKFYDNDITEKEIERATKDANIYDFIQTLPNKFNSEIGEKGVLLSMGQRQRIVIARTLVRKPAILILDEATSALDSESEIKIQKVIENLKGKITVIAIAHRLSTVINSDKILVLENGGIVEQGEPQKLLKDKGSYFYKVYNIRNGE